MRTRLIKDRFKVIEDYVRGKDVLDVGCAGCPYNPKKVPYDIIKKEARSYIGLDLRKSDDPHIVEGNAETKFLKRKFDVVVAGDLIEHVSNQGLFLDNMRRHLRPSGRLIISTPNIKSRWLLSPTNPEHVLWHSKQTLLQLLDRHDLKVVEFYYYFGNKRLFILFELFKEIFYRLFPPMAEAMMVVLEEKGAIR